MHHFRAREPKSGAEPRDSCKVRRENSERLAHAVLQRKSWSDCAAVFVLRQLLGKECVAYIPS